ncbi:hypothetical protein ACE2AJ_05635 [Aquihabitans daechungensis]|uniref:hypothetical protein n=1 Tax=Aquihabitans daechungensis TaxID=1052257 RepID=UPI003BA2FE50
MTETTVRRPRRRTRAARITALLAAPLLLLVTSCKITDITDPIVKPIEKTFEEIFNLDSGEISTPQFEIVNGITIKVTIKFSDLSAGLPVTVQVKCAGGTQASATVVLKDTGSISVGETTFQPTWPAGTDCVVSQDIVKGVETVKGIVTWIDSNDVQAVFQNT